MSQAITPAGVGSDRSKLGQEAIGSHRFDWAVAALSVALVGGVYLDGWAHNNGRVDDTFFTPWHAVLYSAMLLTGLFLAFHLVRNVSRGRHWRTALPAGYWAAFLGVMFFGVAGVADLAWHEIFGFEEDVEALLSPSHLALGTGGFLIITAPLRAAWRRNADEGGRLWPAVLSLFAMLSLFTFFTQFANAFSSPSLYTNLQPGGNAYPWDVTLISYVLIPSALLMFVILLGLRRWRLPAGSLTVIIGANAALLYLERISFNREQWYVVLVALAAGLIADGLLATLKPSVERVTALRWFAFAVPFVTFLLFFAALIALDGIWWAVHLWLGVTVMAGLVGLGLSYLLVPPTLPPGQRIG